MALLLRNGSRLRYDAIVRLSAVFCLSSFVLVSCGTAAPPPVVGGDATPASAAPSARPPSGAPAPSASAAPTASAAAIASAAPPPSVVPPAPAADDVGGEGDAHGCLASAAQIWSPLRRACVRPFDKGIRVNPVPTPKDGARDISAFVIFATDERAPAKNPVVELLILSEPAPLQLTQTKGGVYAREGSPFTVTAGKRWTVERAGKVIYRQAD